MPQIYAIIFVLAIAGMFYGDYKYTQMENRNLRIEVQDSKHTINTLETQARTKKVIDEANLLAVNILNESQLINEEAKQERTRKASAQAIQTTLDERSEKYEGFIERVGAKNAEVIECRSDYRRMRDEKACIGHVH